MKILNLVLLFLCFTSLSFGQNRPEPKETEVWAPVPKPVTSGIFPGAPPSDAIVLFDGKDLSKWRNGQFAGEEGDVEANALRYAKDFDVNYVRKPAGWFVEAGEMVVNTANGGIETEKSFGDVQLHIEWLCPENIDENTQLNGNSGIFFMGLYELQVLNSYNTKTYSNGQAGSIYKQHIPLVNASRKPSTWQYYDAVFHAPEFNADGSVKTPATLTAFHNGVLVQDNVELWGPTAYIGKARYFKHPKKLPLRLQDHDDVNKVRFRNIWVREL